MDENTPLMSPTDTDSGNPKDATAKTNSVSLSVEDASSTIEEKAVANTKKKGTKLTFLTAYQLKAEIQSYQLRHALAAKYFEKRQFWLFTIPQALLSMFSSILAFVVASKLLNENQKTIVSAIAGSTSFVVVFLQTLSGFLKYETRGTMHDTASVDLSDLLSHLKILSIKLGFEESMNGGTGPKHADDGEEENHDGDDTFEEIMQKFNQSLVGCKSIIPLELNGVWHNANSELRLTGTDASIEQFGKVYTNPQWCARQVVNLDLKLFSILAEQIMDYPLFPFFLPNPKPVAKASMKRLREEVGASFTFWDGVSKRDDNRSSLACPTGGDEIN